MRIERTDLSAQQQMRAPVDQITLASSAAGSFCEERQRTALTLSWQKAVSRGNL